MSDMTTTPITPTDTQPRIEAVIGDDALERADAGPALTITDEWRRVGAFLKRPSLAVGVQDAEPLKVLARIYALDIAMMALLIGLASVLIALGVYIPETALAGMEFTLGIVLLVVIGAPVLEEVAFRGWLSGRPGPMLALLALAAGGIGFGLAHVVAPAVGALLAIAGVIGAGLALFLMRNAQPMAWFARAFPVFFWLSTVAFALVHLANFEEGSLALLLPLVLPQFILGALLGYVRVRFALWTSILLHAAHNATALSIAALAGALGA